ncbi:MAG: carboxy terminal-processing peptidase [Victivallales bacterium]|nr:carboxy terminal-processing peptidase [Victivallales bacterium]
MKFKAVNILPCSLRLLVAVALLGVVWTVYGEALPDGELATKLESLRQAQLMVPSPGTAEQLIARTVIQTTLSLHYNYQPFTPQLSSQWFQGYFEMLDSNKNFFLQSDLDEFQEVADTLYLQNSRRVQLDFPYQVYLKFLERNREYVLFCSEELFRPQDFSVDESLPGSRKAEEMPWAATVAELHDRWRRLVKNTLLSDVLTQEQLAKEKEDGEESAKPSRRREDVRVRTVRSLISSFRVRTEANSMDILEIYLNAFLQLFDPHTSYMAPESKEDFDISMSLSLQGIGATLSWKDGYTTVSSLVPGGPAARDGRLKPGDRIIAVAQSADEEPLDVVGMKLTRVVQHIRGAKGTEVFLTVQPEGSGDVVIYRLVRDQIVLKDSEAQLFEHQVPVDGLERPARVIQLYLPSFYSDFGARDRGDKNYKSTTTDLKKLLSQALETGPVDGVILDLRGNGGGSLDEAVALCGLFSGNVPVVQVRNQQNGVKLLRASRRVPIYTGPLMVMVDRNSASASEIVAACLQDSERAVVVGDCSTHGKGTVQSLNDLMEQPQLAKSKALLGKQDPGSLKLTFAKFYRINGGSTQERGVEPDITFPSFLEYTETSEKNLPHCLPWDEIAPVNYTRQTELRKHLSELQDVANKYMAQDPNFAEYVSEVEAYRKLRELNELPLEINARRDYRARDHHSVQMIRRFQPKRPKEEDDEPETLKSDEEVLMEKEQLPQEDVVLNASLMILGEAIKLNQEDAHAFSVK